MEGLAFRIVGERVGTPEIEGIDPVRTRHLLHEVEQGATNERFRRQFGRLDGVDERIDAPDYDALDDRLEELFLGLEIQVRESLADTGALGHLGDGGRRVAFLGEHGECSLGDFLWPVFLAPLEARFCHAWHLTDSWVSNYSK